MIGSKAWWLAAAALALPGAGWAEASRSVYLTRPDDPRAVTVQARGDGRADDTDAVQRAIDSARGATGHGLVFLPSGRYRLTHTLLVPEGVRVLGVGRTRPVLVLGDDTPGFQQGVSTLVVFTGEDQYRVGQVPVPVPTIVPRGRVVRDANSGTFYSAMANIDVELGQGNPAAAAVRFRVAQHGFLSHMDFRLGSGFAGVYQAGNVMEDVHFHGGRYGIVTEKTSPAWQFTLIDSSFDGQRDAAIREHEVDLTLVNVAIRDVPVGIDIDEGYSDSLWGKDVRFERVSRAGVIVSAEGSAFTQIGFDDAVARDTPVFAHFRESGRDVPGQGRAYRVVDFGYGLALPGPGRTGTFATTADIKPLAALPAPRAPAIRALPPISDWTNVHSLGAKGDGQADDTAALQRAINGHRVLYFPAGFYKVTGTLRLKPDTVLLGLHPAITQLFIPDNDPLHAGVGSAVPIVEAPRGGRTMLSGLGLFTGRVNPRASAILWHAGEQSLIDDVKIMGGGGTPTPDGQGLGTLNGHSGDPVADSRFDAQYPSIMVAGGGGTFADIWTPNTLASAGFAVSDTDVPGHVYQLSNEHHVRHEIVLDHASHWEFLAPQTEQEVAEGINEVSLDVRHSHDLLFANYHSYRVTRQFHPATTAVRLFDSGDIRFRNLHSNAESGFASCQADGCGTYLRASKFPFENAITDVTDGLEVREREFARLDVPAAPPPVAPATIAGIGPVTRLAGGFFAISGAAADAKGQLYFVERRMQRIYRWSTAKRLEVVRDDALDPVSLGVDRSGHLLVLSSFGPEGTIYSVDPDAPPAGEVTLIAPTPVAEHKGAATLLPGNWWNNGEFRDQYDAATDRFTTLSAMFARDAGTAKPREYVSPDGSLVLPAFRVWQQGTPDHLGWRFSDTLDALGLVAVKPGTRALVTDESEDKTISAAVGAGGALSDLRTVATRGGESAVADASGRVFVANGQVFVYAADGSPLGQVDVPDRPVQLVIGGEGGRTLFILTTHALYAAALSLP